MKENNKKDRLAWSRNKRFSLTWITFTLVAVIIGAPWHVKLFAEQYKSFNFITATEVIVPLALSSMLLLGFISTYFFSYLHKNTKDNLSGIKTGLIVLLIPRLAVTFAFAAEQNVNGKALELILLEFGLYSIMAIVWGFIAGRIYK
tara:strand:+ start:571 stop:1008 length:438 start_codon:yes stop_codon:yes gene_type:complete